VLRGQLNGNPEAGDRIPGVNGPVFKVRISSQDMQRGKSGGYRAIYFLKTQQGVIYLLAIYAKAQREDIRPEEINAILRNLDI